MSPIPLPPPKIPWGSTARQEVMSPAREVSADEAMLRQAVGDPGSFTARGYDGIDYEPLVQWQARAVIAAVQRTGGLRDL